MYYLVKSFAIETIAGKASELELVIPEWAAIIQIQAN